MSKRARLNPEDAKKAGLAAWETPEGRRWLLKALNPNDVSVVSSGIPTLHSRNISVLNWQGEYTMDVPSNISAAVPSYDCTVFLYQHPLIFGMCASRPNGTIDMRDIESTWRVSRAAATGGGYYYKLEVSTPGSSPVSLTRCSQYLNSQVDPTVFGGDKSLAARRKLYGQLTQKSRVAYGGVTIIPTCSADNNSGTLAVCQQVFSPRKSLVGNNNNIELDSFLPNDFPDTADLVQNPQMYYGRFQDGAYIPYKLNDPSSMEYVNSEQTMTTRAPYFVENVAFLGTDTADEAAVTGAIVEHFPDPSGVNDTSSSFTDTAALYRLMAVRLYVQSYTGQRGYITLSLAGGAFTGASKLWYIDDGITFKNCVAVAPTDLIEGATATPTTGNALELNDLYLKVPELITCWNWIDTTLDNANPPGCLWNSTDITTNAAATDPDLKKGVVCPYNGQSLVTVQMSGISNTAPIKMLLRYGVEILLVASSAYSPFKFMSPKYDESAIKSYARCIRSMKDAYFANAGSVVGQADYANKLMTLIETDSAEDLNRTLNQGGAWSGVVGAY